MGKIRMLTLIPTQCMTADSLTKSMIHASMLLLLTTGIIKFFNVDKHHVTSRIMPSIKDYNEHDLLKDDTDAEGDQGEAGNEFQQAMRQCFAASCSRTR